MLEGAINQDLGEQVSIKALEMVWGRKQTRPEVGQEGGLQYLTQRWESG